jgi:hypothetical protein
MAVGDMAASRCDLRLRVPVWWPPVGRSWQARPGNPPTVRDTGGPGTIAGWQRTPQVNLAGFDRYVEEHGIPEEHCPAAVALRIAQHVNGRVPRFEKVEREPADGVVIEGDDF